MTLNVQYGQRPPNFEAIAEVYPEARKTGVIFAYGDTIYVSGWTPLSPALIAHETVHCNRQLAMGVDAWWKRYLTDKKFMFEEEVLAHQAEFEKATAGMGRQQKRAALATIAKRLSSPLYGKAVSFAQAKMIIQGTEPSL